jgi:hypothetical protein
MLRKTKSYKTQSKQTKNCAESSNKVRSKRKAKCWNLYLKSLSKRIFHRTRLSQFQKGLVVPISYRE